MPSSYGYPLANTIKNMKYHAPTKQFTVTSDALESASRSMLWAIKHIREGHDLDTRGYKKEGAMEHPQFAEHAILDAAMDLGIDLGADRDGVLDVSQSG